MEMESFTISDESFALLEASLKRNRERIRTERDKRKLECLETCTPGVFCHHLETATVHERNLLHESLIEDLKELGLAEFTRQGKKELCDKLTEHAIKQGRQAMPGHDLDVFGISSSFRESIRKLQRTHSNAK